jgi:hypothetical protein
MWRVAVYAHETPGRHGRARLDRQVARLAVGVARRRDWWHVATYADQSLGVGWRAGLSALRADAPGRFDLVVVDGWRRLSADRNERDAVVSRLKMAGVATVVLGPSVARRVMALAADMALVDLIDGVTR